MFQKKQIHQFIERYWFDYFPRLPAYQTFVARLNLLAETFHTIGEVLSARLQERLIPEFDPILDSFPIMLATGGHAYTATVARDIASIGYCAAKKTYFHGVRLHCIAPKRFAQIPQLPQTTLLGDLAYPEEMFQKHLEKQQSKLRARVKKPKGGELSKIEKYHKRLISKFRQPIESFFNWLNEKTFITESEQSSFERCLNGALLGKTDFCLFLARFQLLIRI